MTFILRVLASVAALLMAVFFVMPIMLLKHGTSPIRDTIASVVFLVIAVLAMRCTGWLWRRQRFWTEIRSLSEVAAFGCLLLMWPLVAFLEPKASVLMKDATHISFLIIAFSVYFFVKSHGRSKNHVVS